MTDREAIVRAFLAHRSRANRDAVIAAHAHLCRRAARKFRRAETDPADLEQVAAIGLIKATDMYRAERTTPFEAYAWMMVVGELMHFVRDHELPIRMPRQLRSLERRYVRAWEEIAARDQAEPTTRDLAKELNVSEAVVEQLRSFRLNQRAGESEGDAESSDPPVWERLPARTPAITLEERLTVIMAVDELPERERLAVLGTFAAGLTQSDVARMLGVSQSQVSKILSRAIEKLHRRVA